jgi:septal ring factor EnvC (AmiA/AmiB activator)
VQGINTKLMCELDELKAMRDKFEPMTAHERQMQAAMEVELKTTQRDSSRLVTKLEESEFQIKNLVEQLSQVKQELASFKEK